MRQNFFGVSASVLLFLLLFMAMKWPFFVAATLSIGTYFGVYYLAKPKQKSATWNWRPSPTGKR